MQRINRINRPFLLAPTADQFDAYNLSVALGNKAFQYHTGPRHAQQLADRTSSGVLGVAKYKAEQAKIAYMKAK